MGIQAEIVVVAGNPSGLGGENNGWA